MLMFSWYIYNFNNNFISFLMWQVVKFTKSFELLSPKCSADTENRLVLISYMVNGLLHFSQFWICFILVLFYYGALGRFGWGMWAYCFYQDKTPVHFKWKIACVNIAIYILKLSELSQRRNQEITNAFLLLNLWRIHKCHFDWLILK